MFLPSQEEDLDLDVKEKKTPPSQSQSQKEIKKKASQQSESVDTKPSKGKSAKSQSQSMNPSISMHMAMSFHEPEMSQETQKVPITPENEEDNDVNDVIVASQEVVNSILYTISKRKANAKFSIHTNCGIVRR